MSIALATIKNADLPVKYEAARLALAECNQIDECKDWADKAAALASYAKQAEDKGLEIMALRIRARAIQRAGELLLEVEKANGAHRKRVGGGPFSTPSLSRKSVAAQAGMSERQAKVAIRVANVGKQSFEQQVESRKPPTITALAEQGKINGKPAKPVPLKELFHAVLYLSNISNRFVELIKNHNLQKAVEELSSVEREKLRVNAERTIKHLTLLLEKL